MRVRWPSMSGTAGDCDAELAALALAQALELVSAGGAAVANAREASCLPRTAALPARACVVRCAFEGQHHGAEVAAGLHEHQRSLVDHDRGRALARYMNGLGFRRDRRANLRYALGIRIHPMQSRALGHLGELVQRQLEVLHLRQRTRARGRGFNHSGGRGCGCCGPFGAKHWRRWRRFDLDAVVGADGRGREYRCCRSRLALFAWSALSAIAAVAIAGATPAFVAVAPRRGFLVRSITGVADLSGLGSERLDFCSGRCFNGARRAIMAPLAAAFAALAARRAFLAAAARTAIGCSAILLLRAVCVGCAGGVARAFTRCVYAAFAAIAAFPAFAASTRRAFRGRRTFVACKRIRCDRLCVELDVGCFGRRLAHVAVATLATATALAVARRTRLTRLARFTNLAVIARLAADFASFAALAFATLAGSGAAALTVAAAASFTAAAAALLTVACGACFAVPAAAAFAARLGRFHRNRGRSGCRCRGGAEQALDPTEQS